MYQLTFSNQTNLLPHSCKEHVQNIYSIRSSNSDVIACIRCKRDLIGYKYVESTETWQQYWSERVFSKQGEYSLARYPWLVADKLLPNADIIVLKHPNGVRFYGIDSTKPELTLLKEDGHFHDVYGYTLLFGNFYPNKGYIGVMTRNSLGEVKFYAATSDSFPPNKKYPLFSLDNKLTLTSAWHATDTDFFATKLGHNDPEAIGLRTNKGLEFYQFNPDYLLERVIYTSQITKSQVSVHDHIFFADLTHQKYQDILHLNDSGLFVYQFDRNKEDYTLLHHNIKFTELYGWLAHYSDSIQLADINNDSYDDLIFTGPQGISALRFDFISNNWQNLLSSEKLSKSQRYATVIGSIPAVKPAILQPLIFTQDTEGSVQWAKIVQVSPVTTIVAPTNTIHKIPTIEFAAQIPLNNDILVPEQFSRINLSEKPTLRWAEQWDGNFFKEASHSIARRRKRGADTPMSTTSPEQQFQDNIVDFLIKNPISTRFISTQENVSKFRLLNGGIYDFAFKYIPEQGYILTVRNNPNANTKIAMTPISILLPRVKTKMFYNVDLHDFIRGYWLSTKGKIKINPLGPVRFIFTPELQGCGIYIKYDPDAQMLEVYHHYFSSTRKAQEENDLATQYSTSILWEDYAKGIRPYSKGEPVTWVSPFLYRGDNDQWYFISRHITYNAIDSTEFMQTDNEPYKQHIITTPIVPTAQTFPKQSRNNIIELSFVDLALREKRSSNYIKRHVNEISLTNISINESTRYSQVIPYVNQSNVSYKIEEELKKFNFTMQNNYLDSISSSGSTRLQFWPINLMKNLGIIISSILPVSWISDMMNHNEKAWPSESLSLLQPDLPVKQQTLLKNLAAESTLLEMGDQWLNKTDMNGLLTLGILLVKKWTGYKPQSSEILSDNQEISIKLDIQSATLVDEFQNVVLKHARSCGIRSCISDIFEDSELYCKTIQVVRKKLALGELEAIPQLLYQKLVQNNVKKVTSKSTQVQANKLLARVAADIPNLQQQFLEYAQDWLSYRKHHAVKPMASQACNNIKQANVGVLRQAISSIKHVWIGYASLKKNGEIIRKDPFNM